MKIGSLFSSGDNRNLKVFGIAIVFAIYARFSGDIRPLAVFVTIVAAIFLFDLANFIMGKLNS